MGFDGLLEEFKKENESKITTTPAIVTETIEYGVKLVSKDYLPELRKVDIIKPYLDKFKHMDLYKMGWRFQFGANKQWAGLCSISNKPGFAKSRNIYVSIDFVKHDTNWKENMHDTIMHEISHAIVFEIFTLNKALDSGELHRVDDLHRKSEGHGLVWKAVCAAIGGGGKNSCRIEYENHKFKDSFKKYMYACPHCSNKEYADFPNFAETCSSCGTYVAVRPNVE